MKITGKPFVGENKYGGVCYIGPDNLCYIEVIQKDIESVGGGPIETVTHTAALNINLEQIGDEYITPNRKLAGKIVVITQQEPVDPEDPEKFLSWRGNEVERVDGKPVWKITQYQSR